ncbi:MAG TPA: hypothetical protein VFO52_03020 [Longimicrobiales bacterium]|nr:hypothetical protein [Longimicrobiales bacterium]
MKKLILAAALLLSACATGQTVEGSAETLDIRVHNNLVPPAILTISLVPSSGPERNLGQAWSSRSTDFRYNGIAPRGQYRLVARASDNRYMASDIVVLDGVEALEWSLQSNRVTILRTRNE